MKNTRSINVITLAYLVFGVLIIQNSCIKAQNMEYLYADGSGNTYVFNNDSIEYNPITPEMSSSGIYSGGDYVKKKIKESDFENIKSIYDRIFKKKKIHIKNRIKTSGQLEIFKNDKFKRKSNN